MRDSAYGDLVQWVGDRHSHGLITPRGLKEGFMGILLNRRPTVPAIDVPNCQFFEAGRMYNVFFTTEAAMTYQSPMQVGGILLVWRNPADTFRKPFLALDPT